MNVISTVKAALSHHTALVGTLSPCLKGHTPRQPSTPDLSARLKKEPLTASFDGQRKGWVGGGL